MLKKPPETRVVKEFLVQKIYSPEEMAQLRELKYGVKLTPYAFRTALQRQGITANELAFRKELEPENNPKLCSCGKDLLLFPKDIRFCSYCGNESIEVPREQNEKLNETVKEMDMPFRTAAQFINNQIDEVLQKYKEYKRSRGCSEVKLDAHIFEVKSND